MGLKEFKAALQGYRKIVVDTTACIYFLQGQSKRFPMVLHVFERAASGGLEIEIPGIVQFELLVQPYTSGDMTEMQMVRRLTQDQPGVRTMAVTQQVIFVSAEVRAVTRMKAPDSLVIGSATATRCDAIVGNDKRYAVLNRMESVQLLSAGMRPLPLPRYVHIDDFVE